MNYQLSLLNSSSPAYSLPLLFCGALYSLHSLFRYIHVEDTYAIPYDQGCKLSWMSC